MKEIFWKIGKRIERKRLRRRGGKFRNNWINNNNFGEKRFEKEISKEGNWLHLVNSFGCLLADIGVLV